jgi:iron complex outermembrane receptor protein
MLALGSTAMLCSQITLAQTADQGADENATIQDIIVTAERRATNLQDTPLSILAVTQEAVEAKGVQDLQDLASITPNLTITPTRGGGNNTANFVIRGIGGGGGATGERGVGLYVDGIYMPRTSGAILRVLDIDRIEVLRGPQGTLFGRNSTGGAIRIFSKQPIDTSEGYLKVTGGNLDRIDVVGMVNMPLGEGVAMRVQGAYLSQGGYVSRGTEMLGEQRDIVARGQLKFEPSDKFRATLGVFYNDSHQNGTPYVFESFDMRPGIEPGPGFAGVQGNYADWINDGFKQAGQAPLAAYNDPRIVKGEFSAPDLCFMDDFNPDYDAACNQFSDDEYWQADLNMSLDLTDNLSLTSVSGYGKLKHRGLTDYQVLGTETRTENVDSEVLYQELQLNASLGSVIDLVAGANYFREEAESPNFIVTRRGTSIYPANPGNLAPNPPGTPANGDAGLFRTADIFISQISKSWGVFGSATWHIVDGLNLTGGLRQAWDSKAYLQTRNQATDLTVAPGTTSTTVTSSADFKALDYRATLDYHFNDDAMIYATVSKAYKAGQFSYTIVGWTQANNATGAAQSAGIKPIPNEKVINYEAGLRLSLFDRRVRLNPTVFIMDYTDRQAAVQVNCATAGIPAAQCPVGFVIQVRNQGDVRLKGIEIDGQIAITPNWTIDGSFAITDPELRNPPAGTDNLFPDVASPTGTIGGTYTRHESFGDVVMNLNFTYVGKQSTHPSQGTDSSYTLASYGLVNGRIQFKLDKVPLTISAFANNILDRTYSTYAQRFGGGFWDSGAGTGVAAPPRNAVSQVRGRPREVGVTLQYSF